MKKQNIYIYLHCNENARSVARQRFKLEQKKFRTKYRYYKRKYKQEKITNIEHFRTDDPKQFWNIIRNLGPKSSNKHLIPIKAKSASGDIIFESSEVLDVWKQNFCSLFTSKCKDTISISLFDQCVFHICLSEMNNIFSLFLMSISNELSWMHMLILKVAYIPYE